MAYTATNLQDVDTTKPDGSTEAVSILDDARREIALATKNTVGAEHDLTGGRHKFGAGTTAARNAIVNWVVGSLWINTDTSPAKLQRVVSLGPTTWEDIGDIAGFNTHVANQAEGVHGSASAPTASRLVHRDAAGRAEVAAPVVASQIARKDTVDAAQAAVQANLDAHIAVQTAPIHGSTSAPTADKLVHRDAAGRTQVATPSVAADVARKDTVDAAQAAVQANLDSHTAAQGAPIHGSTSAPTANKLVHRDGAGNAQVAAPSVAADIARKDTVDAAQAAVQANLDAHIAAQAAPIHGSAVAATADKLVHRDAAGRTQVADPSVAADVATKGYADGVLDETQGTRNLAINGDQEDWRDGTAVAAFGWTLVGAGASVARDAVNFVTRTFAASVTRITNDCQYERDAIAEAGGQAFIRGKVVTLHARVRATVASRVRLRVNDGVGSSFSSYHSGGGAFELLSITRTLDAAATALKAGLQIDTGDTNGQIDTIMLAFGDRLVAFALRGETSVFRQVFKRANYTAGTVSIAGGTPTIVTGTGTSFVANVDVGMFFKVNANGTLIEIQSVDSNTQLTLKSAYPGTPHTGVAYTVTNVYTKPSNLVANRVITTGGGGGSGGGPTLSSDVGASGGGGAAGYSESVLIASAIGATEVVTVGAGGAAGAVAGAGGTGGASSFGTLVVANGGIGSLAAPASDSSAGADGAAAGTGQVALAGGDGSPGLDTLFRSGIGGSSAFGGAGKSVKVIGVTTSPGTPGKANTGGGAGGCVDNQNVTVGGSAGGSGIVIVQETLVV